MDFSSMEISTNVQSNPSIRKFGFISAVLTGLLTVVTFAIAINTPPISGTFCMEDCIDYPYHDIVDRFPRDYIWMFPAILLNIAFITLMVCYHYFVSNHKKIFSVTALIFAAISTTILNIDYFTQLVIIQPSIINAEFDGIAILTQYNPHGVFIALEEFGYLMMSISFLFAGIAYSSKLRFGKSLKWMLIIGFLLSVISLIYTRIYFGLNTGYLFEVVIITINWLVQLIFSIMISIVFYRTNHIT